MRGMNIFQKPYYREISTMRGRPVRGLPVRRNVVTTKKNLISTKVVKHFSTFKCLSSQYTLYQLL